MSKKDLWEFDCPQFVDFAAGLDNSSLTEDEWIGISKDGKKIPSFRPGPKMATPKPNPIKSIPFVVNAARPIKTDDEKIAALSKLTNKLSKSDKALNVVESQKFPKSKPKSKIKGKCYRRSLSEPCIKVQKKCPISKCLNLAKIEPKSKAKTTEELELEKIAILQNKVTQYCRLNEINLKRMKMNKDPIPVQTFIRNNKLKQAPALKNEKLEEAPNLPFNDFEKGIRKSRIKVDNNKKRLASYPASKAPQILSNENLRGTASINPNIYNNPSSSNIMTTANEKCARQLQRRLPLASIAHSGINFLPNKEKTIQQPFSFDSSSTSSHCRSFRIKHVDKAYLSISKKSTNIFRNKENFNFSVELGLNEDAKKINH